MLFKIDGQEWTLDLRPGKGSLTAGPPPDGLKADLVLTISDTDFVKLVMGKMGPQQVSTPAM